MEESTKVLTIFKMPPALKEQATILSKEKGESISCIVSKGMERIMSEKLDVPRLKWGSLMKASSINIPEKIRLAAKIYAAKKHISLADMCRFSLELQVNYLEAKDFEACKVTYNVRVD